MGINIINWSHSGFSSTMYTRVRCGGGVERVGRVRFDAVLSHVYVSVSTITFYILNSSILRIQDLSCCHNHIHFLTPLPANPSLNSQPLIWSPFRKCLSSEHYYKNEILQYMTFGNWLSLLSAIPGDSSKLLHVSIVYF